MMPTTQAAENQLQWIRVTELARRFHCSWRTIYKHLYKNKSNEIVWMKLPFARGLRARLDTIIAFERKLQTHEQLPEKKKGRLKVWV